MQGLRAARAVWALKGLRAVRAVRALQECLAKQGVSWLGPAVPCGNRENVAYPVLTAVRTSLQIPSTQSFRSRHWGPGVCMVRTAGHRSLGTSRKMTPRVESAAADSYGVLPPATMRLARPRQTATHV